MTLREQIKIVASAFMEARNLKAGRVSTLVFGDGMKLPRLMRDEVDLTTARFERSMLWFSENWPAGADWPAGVPRTAPSSSPQAAE